MARRPQLEPAWLIGLLNAWARHSHKDHTRGLGWYSASPMLKGGIPVRARSYEPMGYCEADYTAVYEALQGLDLMPRMAVGRYFKPWARSAIEAEFQRSADQWLVLLRVALQKLEEKLRLPVADIAKTC